MCQLIIEVCTKKIKPVSGSASIPCIASRAWRLFDNFGISTIWSWIDGMIEANPRLRHVLENQLWHDIDAMLAIGGELCTGQLCWYVDIVTDSEDREYAKRYVGQAEIDFHRLTTHLEELRISQNNKSLHYWIGTQETRQSNLITIHMDSILTDLLYRTISSISILSGAV